MIPYQVPVATPEGQAFWEGCKNHQLLIPQCLQCKQYHFYPRAVCPHCWSNEIAHIPVSGKGAVYSFTVTYPKESPPYVVALIELEENVRILSNMIDCSYESVKIGMPVRVTFREIPDSSVVIPQFIEDK